MKTTLLPILLSLLLLSFVAAPAMAEDYKATTTADPKIPLDWLELELRPKTRSELAVETAAWRDLLQAQLATISVAEIAEKRGEEQKALPALREGRDGLIARLDTALAAFAEKGGDADVVAEYTAYLGAVAGTALEGVDTDSASGIVSAVLGWLTSETGGLKLLKGLLMFVLVILGTGIVARILGRIVSKAVSRWKNASELLKDFFVNVVKKLTMLIGVVVALSTLGINIGPFVAAIGAAGFIIGFALQGTLSNFASGILILLYRPYDLGEVVSVGGVTGKVEQMSLVSTSVLTPDNQTVIVPNGTIWGDVITNITGNDTRRVDLTFGIGYSDDMAEAQKILEKIMEDHPKVFDDPAPVIKVHELADSSVNFIVRPWVKTADYWDVYWDVTRAVKERFDAKGISIPFPQQEVTMHQAPSPA